MEEAARKHLYWIPAIIMMTLIFWFSSHPVMVLLKFIPRIFGLKLVHIVEYGLLFYFYRFALVNTTKLRSWEIFLLSFELTIVYGLTDEFHQIFITGRTAKFIDVVADGVGATIVQIGMMIKPDRQK